MLEKEKDNEIVRLKRDLETRGDNTDKQMSFRLRKMEE